MAARYRLCPKCKYRYERIKQKCPSCGKARPKRRVRGHAVALQGDNYESVFVKAAQEIHGVYDESCCVCGKPKPKDRRHDREHGHKVGDAAYAKARGIACSKCNMLMKFTELDAKRAWLIWQYLQRVEDFYTKPEDKRGAESQEADPL